MRAERSVEVCIVGAGPVGGLLACRLAAAGIATALVDHAPLPPMEHPDFDGRAYAIAAGIRPLFAAAGAWDTLPFVPGPIRGIRVTDGRVGRPASRLFLHFDAGEVGEGPFGWMIEARSLRMALNRRFPELPALSVHAPARAEVVRAEAGATITLDDGTRLAARLVVAAEGRASPLREQAGIRVTRIPYRQSAVVGCVAHERAHEGVALEHFLPAGPFAQLPMAPTAEAPHLSAIVWTERTQDAARAMALDDAAFAGAVARRMGDHLGAVRAVGRRWTYPLSAMLVHRYVATRLALVGDAAHGVHPIAGQGLNLGLRDALALGDQIETALARGEDPGGAALLARYQAARRPDNLAMLVATDALDRLFSTDFPPARLARDLGIAAVHRLPPLRRAFMRAAMGA